jgi:TctA family transporter
MAVALLVPVTFYMDPVPAVAAMVTASAMAMFSGDIPSVLLRMPGKPASAAYTDDAFALTKKGQAHVPWAKPPLANRRWSKKRQALSLRPFARRYY